MKDGMAPTYVQNTIEDHAQANMAAYDVVVASEVIEHVTDKESFLAASIASLKVSLNSKFQFLVLVLGLLQTISLISICIIYGT